MKVVFVDVDSLGLTSVEDAKWIFDNFDRSGYIIIWVFEDFPFKSGSALEVFIESRGFVIFKVLNPARFIYSLMHLPLWYRVDGFIVCSRNEGFVPLLGCGVDAIWFSEHDVVDFFFYESQGLNPERFLDYAVIMDYASENGIRVDEERLLGFLRTYSLEDISHELVRDVVMEAELDFLLKGDFYKVLCERKRRLALEVDEGIDIFEIGKVLYGSKRFLVSKERVDRALLEWRFRCRQMLMSGCRVCGGILERKKWVLGKVVGGAGKVCGKVVIIGEAPGEEEEEKGKPFVGKSGELLNRWLEIAGLSRHDAWITNATLCRLRNAEGKAVAPDKNVVEACRWHVEADVMDSLMCNGKVMIWALGRVALDSLKDLVNVANVKHGLHKLSFDGFEIWLLYLFHPSAILRSNDGSSHLSVINILKSLEKEEGFEWFRK